MVVQNFIISRWGQPSDTRGDPAIVYLDGVQPPLPTNTHATLPDTLQGGKRTDSAGGQRREKPQETEQGKCSSPTSEESDAECKVIPVDEAADSNSEKRENDEDRAESVVSSNNNLESIKISMAELELLKKLEEANRLIENDTKSLNSLSVSTAKSQGSQSGHSRTSSLASQISVLSGSSQELGDTGEDDLWTTWGDILKHWDLGGKRKTGTVKELARAGIPHHFRGMAWQVLCGAHDSSDKSKYSAYLRTQSACEKVIRRDIARTYPEHDFFKKKGGVGQESLFNVMKAYSTHDREVGYCQGSAFIVGLLLMEMPEEDSFAVLVKIMQDYRMREMFKPSMAELGLCMYQLDTLVQEHIPDLYVHFQSQAIHTNLYASSWFLTLFTTSLPLVLSCRVMDCFLSEGMEVIFRISLALLIMGKDELLLQDMEGVLKYFQKYMPAHFEANQEAVFALAFEIVINQKKMKRVEKEYTTMKSKEKEDEIEIRRLKNENRLLRQKVEMLENESNELADRLIQGQVDRAEVDETTFVMKRELAAIRQHDFDTNAKLEEAIERNRVLQEQVDSASGDPNNSNEILAQKEEMIKCLQNELIKIKLKEAENEDTIKLLSGKICQSEMEKKTQREDIPEDSIASLQEELAASKLREAESNLALKDLRSKVGELNSMWLKHIKTAESNTGTPEMPSTPKKFLGSLLEGKSGTAKLEEELMSTRLREVAGFAELKELRLRVMELETQTQLSLNQLKRQTATVSELNSELEEKEKKLKELQDQLEEAQRRFADLEGKLKDQNVRERIRDVEKAQSIAELKQIISNLEFQNQQLVKNSEESSQLMNLEDTMSNLRQQTNNFQLPTPECTPIVEYKLFFPYK